MGRLVLKSRHRLLCGDSTKQPDVARLMNGQQADCVFTSAPYGVGVDYGPEYSDTIDNLRAMLPLIAEQWRSIIVPGGFAVVNFGDIVSGREAAGADVICEYPMALEYWPAFRAAGFGLWSRRVWCKPEARCDAPWTATSNRAATNFEHVWTWKVAGDPIVGRVTGDMRSTVGWFDTSRLDGVDVGKSVHGAGMPTSAAQWMILVHSRDASIVHEPFSGTGTTIVASEQTGRRCYAMDISPRYVDIAVRRFEEFTGTKAIRWDG